LKVEKISRRLACIIGYLTMIGTAYKKTGFATFIMDSLQDQQCPSSVTNGITYFIAFRAFASVFHQVAKSLFKGFLGFIPSWTERICQLGNRQDLCCNTRPTTSGISTPIITSETSFFL
jgi:hypothetical protein